MALLNRQWASSARRLLISMTPLAFLWLSACVESEAPLLTDAKPLFGQEGGLQLYDLSDRMARGPTTATFRWDGGRYAVAGPEPSDTGAFTTHEFEGRDILLQVSPDAKNKTYRYALARKLAEGAYLYFLVDENDADEAKRTKFCVAVGEYTCQAGTREGLLAFARATAAKPHESGGLAIILADEKK